MTWLCVKERQTGERDIGGQKEDAC